MNLEPTKERKAKKISCEKCDCNSGLSWYQRNDKYHRLCEECSWKSWKQLDNVVKPNMSPTENVVKSNIYQTFSCQVSSS